MPGDPRRVQSLFLEAVDLGAAERAVLLEEACAGEPELRRRVEVLLDAHEAPGSLLDRPPAGLTSAAQEPTFVRDPPGAAATYGAASPAPHPEQSPRVRVALVTGREWSAGDDLRGLLLRRLRIFNSILGTALATLFALSLWALQRHAGRDSFQQLGGYTGWRDELLLLGLPLAVSVISAVFLFWRPPASLTALRRIELLVVGSLAGVMLVGSVHPFAYSPLEQAPDEPLHVRMALLSAYRQSLALNWFSLLVIYGTLIPNTWRRTAAVVGALALCPLAFFAAFGLWLRPLDPRIVWNVMISVAFWNGVATALVVFASSRIEVLRQEAAKARKLGQYVLKERLGAGGMGEVYLATHSLLRRPCAIKVIRPERAGDPENLRRFEREVQATATLSHPNTVHVYDYGHADDGTFYYVMEYLPGLTLDELVNRDGLLLPARAVRLLRQICGALAEAHGQGLTHRDVKPGNVMVCNRGGEPEFAKLLDFGLVLPPVGEHEGDIQFTRAGTITGTPAYLSPEQAGGRSEVDARSDIYSVGALAYFLLTGRPPFAGRSPVETLAAHLYERAASIREHSPEVPPDLEEIVLRCLEKDPAERFQDVKALDSALEECRLAP